jgi:4-oxalocrotonate tautomerase
LFDILRKFVEVHNHYKKLMPHIIIKMFPGATKEQKIELTEEITKSIMGVLNKSDDSISVAIEEVAQESWTEEVYTTHIQPNLETLYKKPGY